MLWYRDLFLFKHFNVENLFNALNMIQPLKKTQVDKFIGLEINSLHKRICNYAKQ